MGYARIEEGAIADARLGAQAFRVLCALDRFRRDAPDCWPSNAVLGRAAGGVKERCVRESLRELESLGYIARIADPSLPTHRRIVLTLPGASPGTVSPGTVSLGADGPGAPGPSPPGARTLPGAAGPDPIAPPGTSAPEGGASPCHQMKLMERNSLCVGVCGANPSPEGSAMGGPDREPPQAALGAPEGPSAVPEGKTAAVDARAPLGAKEGPSATSAEGRAAVAWVGAATGGALARDAERWLAAGYTPEQVREAVERGVGLRRTDPRFVAGVLRVLVETGWTPAVAPAKAGARGGSDDLSALMTFSSPPMPTYGGAVTPHHPAASAGRGAPACPHPSISPEAPHGWYRGRPVPPTAATLRTLQGMRDLEVLLAAETAKAGARRPGPARRAEALA